MIHRKRAEDPRHEQQTPQWCLGRDRRRPVGVINQRHLAEVITGAKGAGRPPVHTYRRLPFHDDPEGGAALLLGGQHRTRGKGPVMRLARQPG
jgi:hypothetical protein